MKQNNIRALLEKHPVIPVVTFNTINEIKPVINRLLSNQIHCIEITLRTPIAYDAIEKVKQEYGQMIDIGMGTVTNQDHITKAIELGVDFMVSPGISASLFDAFKNSGIAFIPGVATPSDIILGLSQSWDTFKFFPAHLFGGYEALKTYGQVFPDLKFCPTGGISEDTYQQYLALENVISVGGSWMTK
jgi:2-dehydro-3-deoxyphosphogluconate aldolase/(4S)-4-hydroxy-2-oxoglutarate aldolase